MTYRRLLAAGAVIALAGCATGPVAPNGGPQTAQAPENAFLSAAARLVVPPGSPPLTAADLAEIRKMLPERLTPAEARSQLLVLDPARKAGASNRHALQVSPFHRVPDDLEDFPTVYPDWFYYRFIRRGYPYYWPYGRWGGFWQPWWWDRPHIL